MKFFSLATVSLCLIATVVVAADAPVSKVPSRKAPSPLDAPTSEEPQLVQSIESVQRPPAPSMASSPVSYSVSNLPSGGLHADLFNSPTEAKQWEDVHKDVDSDAQTFLKNPNNAARLRKEQRQAVEQMVKNQANMGMESRPSFSSRPDAVPEEGVVYQDEDRARKRARRDGLRHVVFPQVLRVLSRTVDPFDSFPASREEGMQVHINYTLLHTTRLDGKPLTGYLAVISNPISHFGVFPAPGSRTARSNYKCSLHKTSETASSDGCLFATNAGFFDMSSGACLGNVVHHSKVLQVQSLRRANFGIDKDGNFVSGYLTNDQVSSMDFVELITGRGWLVRNGESVLEHSIEYESIDNRFVTIKAPRTGVGYDSQGRLMILSVDGEEDISAGADMYDFTKLFLDLGVKNAVNLDGGGSGTVYYQGRVVSKPTCDDTPRICERPVTTILCVY